MLNNCLAIGLYIDKSIPRAASAMHRAKYPFRFTIDDKVHSI